MSRKYFGTDGVRGRVGEEPITPEFVMRLGYAAGKVLASADRRLRPGQRPTVLIGKDTRISGYMLESALEAGFSASGVDVVLIGPMPTPGIAYLTRALRLQAGVVISASHNPYEDNGIKFFGAGGIKLLDKVERAVEVALDEPLKCVPSAELGKARRMEDAAARYIEFCKSTFPSDMDLRGIKLVLDCANGASYVIAPHVFHELGADVITIGNQPDGTNINDGFGATDTAALQKAVVEHQADFGIALDGDGDRLIMVDRDGTPFDGDKLLYMIARQRQKDGILVGGVVGTVMTNLGIEHAFEKHKIPFARAAVGDRYVLEMLREKGWQLGGESSGHIICLDKHSTGDGIVSSLQVLQALRSHRAITSLADSTKDVTTYPQVLINVRVPKGFDYRDSLPVQAALVEAECELRDQGRVVLRASGTEPVIRVMLEGKNGEKIKRWAEHIAEIVEHAALAV
ncbi:phosphoglucosamine mutase [Chitinivorax sp. B]|uniref:phosphoglucosamine mutase n=1 Tax=Chitinivorax sp. B TaxID=2502235 RepID=UPI0010F6BEDF|nr:phosphoglucosamine mutase [Chitinivorax sp. B]